MHEKCRSKKDAKWIRQTTVGEGFVCIRGRPIYYKYASKMYRDFITLIYGDTWEKVDDMRDGGYDVVWYRMDW